MTIYESKGQAMLTKRMLLEIFKAKTEIARALGVGRQAVSKWRLDSAIPVYRELQLRALYPTVFGKPAAMVERKIRLISEERVGA